MIPTRVGQKFSGGAFVGVIRESDECYALIVAPGCTETTGIPFKTSKTATPNTQSVNNGWTNTRAMNNDSHPAAQYCCILTEGGYTDWYLPSRDELELCYRYLKPGTDYNTTYAAGNFSGNLGLANGTNPNSVPAGATYTLTNPAQTAVIAFRTGGVEAFNSAYYWTSTEYSATTSNTLFQNFGYGYYGNFCKTCTRYKVRAVRRVLID